MELKKRAEVDEVLETTKWCRHLLHVVGRVSGVGVDVLRHGADLPLLHDLDVTTVDIISMYCTADDREKVEEAGGREEQSMPRKTDVAR